MEMCRDNVCLMNPDSAKGRRGLGDELGSCLRTLRRTRDLKWGIRKKVRYESRHGDSPMLLPSAEEVKKKEGSRKRLREEKESGSKVRENVKQGANERGVEHELNLRVQLEKKFDGVKRKRQGTCTNSIKRKEQKELKRKCRIEKEGFCRWSSARLECAMKLIVEVMQKMGATWRKPVLRHDLRAEVRKHIGDLGLLDYLFKRMAGMVVGDTKDQFVRQYNSEGITEFWLEPADMASIHSGAPITGSDLVPRLGWEHRNVGPKFNCHGHCKTIVSQLKAEINHFRSENEKLMKSLKEKEMLTLEQSQVQLQLQKSLQEKHESLLIQHQKLQNELTSIFNSFLAMKEEICSLKEEKEKREADKQVMFVKEPSANQASEMQFMKEHEKGKGAVAGNEVGTEKKMVSQKGLKNYQQQDTFLKPYLGTASCYPPHSTSSATSALPQLQLFPSLTSSLPSPCSGFFYQRLLKNQCQNQTQAQSVAVHAQSNSIWLAPHPSARYPSPGMRNFEASQMVCDELILTNSPNREELRGDI